MQLSEPAYSQKIYALAFEEIRRHPENFTNGVLKTWPVFFSLDKSSVFGFMGGEQATVAVLARLLLLLLSVIGLAWCVLSWRDPIPAFLLAVLLGTILSNGISGPRSRRLRRHPARLNFREF